MKSSLVSTPFGRVLNNCALRSFQQFSIALKSWEYFGYPATSSTPMSPRAARSVERCTESDGDESLVGVEVVGEGSPLAVSSPDIDVTQQEQILEDVPTIVPSPSPSVVRVDA